jgi:hypothetical protein
MGAEAIEAALRKWPGGLDAAERKMRLFDKRLIELAVGQIVSSEERATRTNKAANKAESAPLRS